MDLNIIYQLGRYAYLYCKKQLSDNPYTDKVCKEAWEQGYKKAEEVQKSLGV